MTVEIERDRAVDGDRPSGLDPVRVDGPKQVVHQAAVEDHRPLRLAGGARRVHHVGEVGGTVGDLEVLGSLVRERLPVFFVEADGRHGPERYDVEALPLGQEHADGRVAHHEREPLRWVGRVERHVRSAGLPYGEERDDELRAPLHAHANQTVGAHAVLPQEAGDAVGSLVELPVREAVLSEDDGGGLGRALHLLLEKLVHADRGESSGDAARQVFCGRRRGCGGVHSDHAMTSFMTSFVPA